MFFLRYIENEGVVQLQYVSVGGGRAVTFNTTCPSTRTYMVLCMFSIMVFASEVLKGTLSESRKVCHWGYLGER